MRLLRPKAEWDITVPKRRTCNVPGFTLATKRAKDSQFLFYEGRLGSWNATFDPSHGNHLRDALADRFGSPLPDPHYSGVIWRFDGANMRLVAAGQSIMVYADSDMQETWQQKLRAFEQRNGKADL